jgi:hypothetical protein
MFWRTGSSYIEVIEKLRNTSTWASAPDDTSTLRALENAKPVILFSCPLNMPLTCQTWREVETCTAVPSSETNIFSNCLQ